ncbi:MAG: hypothetical protein IT561_24635 [Alphaproteobacteria bacterium]|nr:hypothetical protein [Alphaproteobacteria bacterium]
MRVLHPFVLAAVLLAAAPSAAHHGWGSYDAATAVDITGTIRAMSYDNPHGMVHLEVPGKTWMVVLAPPFRMLNRGLPAEMLAVGKTARVVGYPHRSDPTELRAERITVDGKTVELR